MSIFTKSRQGVSLARLLHAGKLGEREPMGQAAVLLRPLSCTSAWVLEFSVGAGRSSTARRASAGAPPAQHGTMSGAAHHSGIDCAERRRPFACSPPRVCTALFNTSKLPRQVCSCGVGAKASRIANTGRNDMFRKDS